MNNINYKINEENNGDINNIKNLAEQMNLKFGEVHNSIDNQIHKREEIDGNYKKEINEIMDKIEEESNRQKKKREEFEENIFTLMEDTLIKLINNNS